MYLKKIERIWAYIVLLLICITTGAEIVTTNSRIQIIFNILLLLLGSIAIIRMMLTYKLIKITYIILPIIILINHIIHPNTTINFIFFIARVYCILSIVLIFIEKDIDFMEILSNIIWFLSVISIIFYVLIGILNFNIPYQSIVYNGIEHRNYLYLFFINQYLYFDGITIVRNSSIFCEPGMFQIFVNFSLIYEIILREKIRRPRVILLIFTVISTTSTTGLIILICTLSVKILSIKIINKNIKVLKSYLIGTIIIFVYISIEMIIISKKSNAVMSFSARSDDLLKGLELFFMHPIKGWGFINYDIYNWYANTTIGNSNGIISLMYQIGILGIIIYLYLSINLYKFMYIKYKSKIYSLYFIIFIMICNFTQPIIYSNFTLLFILVGIIKAKVKIRSYV